LAPQLLLERLPSDRPQEAVCFLCDEYFAPDGTIAILYECEMPMGYLCDHCASTPHHAASKVRRRAKRILRLLKHTMDDDSAEHRLKRLQLILRRAGYWRALARRLEKLHAWR
jgi:hypothetical protein